MKKLFKAVKSGNLDAIKQILETNPEAIHAVAKQPPKSDDGQSLLQVALKTGNLEAANLLLDYRADVNFMEAEDCCNDWRMPVLHDAIRCAVMSSRWNAKDYISGAYVTHSTEDKADKAFCLLKRMLELGADISAKDSYKNTTLERAILDARQLLPAFNYSTKTTADNRRVTPELRHDFARIFKLLFDYGADPRWIDRISGQTIKERYGAEPVAEFLE